MTTKDTAPTTTETPSADDPRVAFTKVADAVGALIEATPAGTITNPTPCPDFTVKELLEHLVLVVRRVEAIGRGDHWSTIDTVATASGWADDYRSAALDIPDSWSDPAILETVLEVPWGEFPGALVMHTYTAELAVHGWDLSQGTGISFSIEDDLLHGALIAAKFIPADDRGHPDMPFSAVVDPGTDAPVLAQLAGWLGRDVLG